MEKIFLDTNIILDIIEERPAVNYARSIIEYSRAKELTHVYASYLTIANAAFVIRKRRLDEIRTELSAIMSLVNILPSGDMQIVKALKCKSPDFEDSLQIACAEDAGCEVIITRNPEHFRAYTEIPVISPEEFVSRCGRRA